MHKSGHRDTILFEIYLFIYLQKVSVYLFIYSFIHSFIRQVEAQVIVSGAIIFDRSIESFTSFCNRTNLTNNLSLKKNTASEIHILFLKLLKCYLA